MAWLVLIETSGNQRYIFATNRMQENVGASQITHEVGTTLVLDALAEIDPNGGHYWRARPTLRGTEEKGTNRGEELRRYIEATEAPRVEAGAGCEVVVATSGKALLVCRDEDFARNVIATVTKRALLDCPGLHVAGACISFDWEAACIHEAIIAIHEALRDVTDQMPHPAARFQQTPLVEPCRTSNLPASTLAFDFPSGGGAEAQPNELTGRANARVSRVKQDHAARWATRLNSMLKREDKRRFPRTPSNLENLFGELEWWAVVHSDGTGFGKIFADFNVFVGATAPSDNPMYCDKLRRFSLLLERVTEAAFLSALAVFPVGGAANQYYPVQPLVLGGDDFWAICDGQHALAFAKRYLMEFERLTAAGSDDLLDEILSAAYAEHELETRHLAASAGVAIVKPHFPFHHSHTLAEELIKNAKTSAKTALRPPTDEALPYPCSTLDFHIVYDSSFTDLKRIREKLIVDGELTQLYSRPYVLNAPTEYPEGSAHRTWVEAHSLATLLERIEAVLDETDGRRKLPASQLAAIREALFMGAASASARLSLIKERYGELKGVLEQYQPANEDDTQAPSGAAYSLWRRIPAPAVGPARIETRFLDVVDSAAFWESAIGKGGAR